MVETILGGEFLTKTQAPLGADLIASGTVYMFVVVLLFVSLAAFDVRNMSVLTRT